MFIHGAFLLTSAEISVLGDTCAKVKRTRKQNLADPLVWSKKRKTPLCFELFTARKSERFFLLRFFKRNLLRVQVKVYTLGAFNVSDLFAEVASLKAFLCNVCLALTETWMKPDFEAEKQGKGAEATC